MTKRIECDDCGQAVTIPDDGEKVSCHCAGVTWSLTPRPKRTTIRLNLPLPPPALRRNHGKHRFVHEVQDAYAEEVGVLVAAQMPRMPWRALCGPLRASVEWRQTGRGDIDNCIPKATFDILGCAPVTKAGAHRFYCGLYESDSQIEELTVRRVQVKTKAAECVIITLEAMR